MFALLVLAGVALYFMTPEERTRLRRAAGAGGKRLETTGMHHLRGDDAFHSELRARVRWPLVTYTLVAANVGTLLMMLLGAGAVGDPATLVAWGGNLGPRTTGGELWRVITSIFVHRGALHLLVNAAALLQLGLLVERLVGPFTFGSLFFAAGVLASIITAAAFPMTVVVGAAGAIFGLYGLLLAVALRGVLPGTAVRIPSAVLLRLAPVFVIFVLYCLATGEPAVTAKVGLCTGFVGGIALTRSVTDYGARLRRFAALGVATAGIVLMSAMALRAVTDVRPELTAVMAAEERTAAAYDAAVGRFRDGRASAGELASLIEGTIVPDMQLARNRVTALADVPSADAPLLSHAQEYLRLRGESWRARAEGLRKRNMRELRDADKIEQASLQAFGRLKSALQN